MKVKHVPVTVGDLKKYLQSLHDESLLYPTSNRIEGTDFRYICLEWVFDDLQFALDNGIPI